MTTTSLHAWTPREAPQRRPFEGRYVRIEPLSVEDHCEALFAASATDDSEDRFRWLGEAPPTDFDAFHAWLEKVERSVDPLWFTVIDKASGVVSGRQTFMRTDAANGVTEIGNILWNPPVARRPAATEALYLFARHVFEDLGYRRFEWKCNNRNGPSKRAALRFGFTFEGVFRQHMVIKGENRNTAWFSMLDRDWPVIGAAMKAWLDPANFDAEGRQTERLEAIRARLAAESPVART